MSRPDHDGTSTRVVERTTGTIIGIGLSIFLVDWVGTGQLGFVLFAALGIFPLMAFINANYSIAVIGITLLVISLFALDGLPVSTQVRSRSTAHSLQLESPLQPRTSSLQEIQRQHFLEFFSVGLALTASRSK